MVRYRRRQVERPLAPWDDDRWSDPRVLWWARLDERYLVEARRLTARRALLLVFDHWSADSMVLRQVLPLVGEPRYGPDPDDVDEWQSRAIQWADRSVEGTTEPEPASETVPKFG